MNDALGKPLFLGDSIVYYRSGNFRLAIVTAEVDILTIDTIHCDVYVRPAYIFGDEIFQPQQTVTAKIARLKVKADQTVKVDHDSFRTAPTLFKPHWASIAGRNQLRIQEIEDKNRRIYDYLRNNFTVKKLKLPDELKIL